MDYSFSSLEDLGYAIIRNALSGDQINELKRDFDRVPLSTNANHVVSYMSKSTFEFFKPYFENELLPAVRLQTSMRPNLLIEGSYFATGRGLKLPWHLDHESLLCLGSHRDQLNLYAVVEKPSIEKSNLTVLPLPVLREKAPEIYCNLIQDRGALHLFADGDRTIIIDDFSGRKFVAPIDLEREAMTPLLQAGDILALRGDVPHRTQDSKTNRIAASFRAANSNSRVNRRQFQPTSIQKALILARNAVEYRARESAFDLAGSDELSLGEHLSLTSQTRAALADKFKVDFELDLIEKVCVALNQMEKKPVIAVDGHLAPADRDATVGDAINRGTTLILTKADEAPVWPQGSGAKHPQVTLLRLHRWRLLVEKIEALGVSIIRV